MEGTCCHFWACSMKFRRETSCSLLLKGGTTAGAGTATRSPSLITLTGSGGCLSQLAQVHWATPLHPQAPAPCCIKSEGTALTAAILPSSHTAAQPVPILNTPNLPILPREETYKMYKMCSLSEMIGTRGLEAMKQEEWL